MARGKAPDPRLKKRCIEAILGGLTISQSAGKYGVPRETVRDWFAKSGNDLAALRQEKLENSADLLADYLERNLGAMHQQIQILSDKKWLQDADPARITAIATAHGITCDKAFRILEAAERARDRSGQRQLGAGTVTDALPAPATDQEPGAPL